MEDSLKAVIGLYVDGIVHGRLTEAVAERVSEQFIEHTPGVGSGRQGLLDTWGPIVARYHRRSIAVVRGFSDAGTVVLHTVRRFGYREVEEVGLDMFDLDPAGRIVEHWGVASPLIGALPSGHSQVDGPRMIEDRGRGAANKAVVAEHLAALISGQHEDATGHLAGSFVDHHAGAAVRPAYQRVVRVAGCGNFVAALSRSALGDRVAAVFDLYRLAGGRVVEHWDTVQPLPVVRTAAQRLARHGSVAPPVYRRPHGPVERRA
ncbi:MAG TPA: hypothetical protein VGJ28_21345 [Micromonosporaceae bacterium]|jgi:predicted SnoaL-like aldol condensation-catalyzing enzyme